MTTPGQSALGSHIARIVGEAIIHASATTADAKAHNTRRHIDAWLEEAEEAYAPRLRGIFDSYLESETLPDQWRTLFEAMAGPTHQWDVLLQIIGFIGAGISGLFTLGPIELQQDVNNLRSDYAFVPLSPADLADMVERNIVGQPWAENEAKKSGISPELFDLLVKDTGEPYGIEQALALLRRGLISEERFTEVLYYSRVRNMFLPDVLALAHEPMSAADAIEATLKAVVSEDQGKASFVRAGGIDTEFDTLLAASGNPVGVEQANMLYQHGLISHEQLVSVIRHSRINPQFESMAELLHFHYIPAYQIRLMLANGAVDAATATTWLLQQGYPADQVAGFIKAGTATKTVKHKDLSETQVLDLYDSGLWNAATATSHLVALGYEPGEVDFILAVYDQRRELAMAQSAIGQVRKTYLAGRIDRTTASNKLDSLGVDPAARDRYLSIWDVEHTSELKELTMAQVGSAFKKGIISDTDATSRWEAMGYSTTDAAVILAIYGGPPPAGSPAAQTPTAAASG